MCLQVFFPISVFWYFSHIGTHNYLFYTYNNWFKIIALAMFHYQVEEYNIRKDQQEKCKNCCSFLLISIAASTALRLFPKHIWLACNFSEGTASSYNEEQSFTLSHNQLNSCPCFFFLLCAPILELNRGEFNPQKAIAQILMSWQNRQEKYCSQYF